MNPDSSDFNPYAPPKGERDPQALSELEKIRHELLGHEAGFKSVGGAYLMVGLVSSLYGTLALLFNLLEGFAPNLWQGLLGLVPGVCLLLASGLLFWLAFGLLRLNEKSRKPFFVCGWIGLVFFPVGTIVNGYLLYLLLSVKGKRTLSLEYRQVIAATPHIRYKSPWMLSVMIMVTSIAVLVLLVYSGFQGP